MVSWNHEVDAKLFVCCLKQLTSTLNYQQLATDMATFDIEVTAKAITHRIAKLKAEAGGKKGGTGTTTPVSTPVKRSTARTPKTPASGKKGGSFIGASSSRNKRKHADPDSSSGDDSEGGDPDGEWGVKQQPKKKKKAGKEAIKQEKDDEHEEDADGLAELALFNAAANAAAEDEQAEPEEV